MTRTFAVVGLCAVAGLLVLAGCNRGGRGVYVGQEQPVYAGPQPVYAAPPQPVYVAEQPPPPIVNVQPPQPDPTFVWVPGEQHWDGHRWQWQHGAWQRPPQPQATWVPPVYGKDKGPQGYQHVPGHWEQHHDEHH